MRAPQTPRAKRRKLAASRSSSFDSLDDSFDAIRKLKEETESNLESTASGMHLCYKFSE